MMRYKEFEGAGGEKMKRYLEGCFHVAQKAADFFELRLATEVFQPLLLKHKKHLEGRSTDEYQHFYFCSDLSNREEYGLGCTSSDA